MGRKLGSRGPFLARKHLVHTPECKDHFQDRNSSLVDYGARNGGI